MKKTVRVKTFPQKPSHWEEDSCAICQAAAQAEREGRDLTLGEFDAAVDQAEKEGAYVVRSEEGRRDD